jgi:hypothetical protein
LVERRGDAGPDSFFDLLSKTLSVRRFPERGARARVARERQRRTLAARDGQAAAGLPPAISFHSLLSPDFLTGKVLSDRKRARRWPGAARAQLSLANAVIAGYA